MKQEIECNCVAALLKYGDLYPEIVHFINENDFDSNLNKTIFVFLKKNLMKGEENDIYSLNSSILSSKINFREYDGELMDYLNAIQMRPITKAAGLKAFKILKRLSVKKLCINSLKEAARNIKCLDNDQPLIKILETLDKTIYNQRFIFDNQDEFVNLTKDIEYILEDRRKNNKEETGFMLPTFPKVNELYGSLLRPGNITIIGARTGVGKTSLGLFTLSQVVAQYGVPMLHLDTGEMTEDEIRDRLVVMLTEGQIPLYDIETGKFGRNKDYINIIRKSTNGVAKKFPIFYKNVGMSSPEEIISVIRRFYYSVVGRGNKAVIHYDYLKGFEAGKYSQEYQIMGLFMQELKTLITRECLLPVWTSLQLNRYGIVNNKKSSEIDDSENSFSISDKIVQQSTHSFILRKKTADEIEDEVGLGNCKLIPIKHRHLGQNHEDAEAFVKLPNGRYVKNYIHLRKRGFFFEEIGDLVSTVDQMGDGILVEKNDNKEKDTEL